MAKGNVVGSCSVQSSSNTQYVLNCSGYFQFGDWYLWGVRVRCYIGGSQVATANGYTTGPHQSCASCSGARTITRTRSAQNISWTVTSESEAVNGIGGIGESHSVSGSITVPAKPSYAVKYDANGGSGAPGQQTKWYGEALTLSSGKPTRSLYNFKGWSTSRNGSPAYQPGSSYDGNEAMTLYAVWEIAYIPPTITGASAQRCDASGTPQDEGEYAVVSIRWNVDTSATPGNQASLIRIGIREYGSGGPYAYGTVTGGTTGTSGTARAVVGGSLSPDKQYEVVMSVKDSTSYSNNTTTANAIVTKAFFTMDFYKGGRGIAFGTAATSNGFECAMSARFTGSFFIGSTALTEEQLSKLLQLIG